MLTIGAFVLLGTLLMANNNLITYNARDSVENEYFIAATALAQSIIDEAKLKSFDENTINTNVTTRSALTANGSLGRDGGGETVPTYDSLTTAAPFSAANPGFRSSSTFDDIDDYKGYRRRLPKARGIEGDTAYVDVVYAGEVSPDSTKSSRTFSKRMTVTVRGKYLRDSVRIQYGFFY